MSTEWTPERLDALPEGTVIEWQEWDAPEWDDDEPTTYRATRYRDRWAVLGGASDMPSWIMRDAISVRVVSVPIDALLAEQTAEALDNAEGWCRLTDILRAAVAHVTGEAR